MNYPTYTAISSNGTQFPVRVNPEAKAGFNWESEIPASILIGPKEYTCTLEIERGKPVVAVRREGAVVLGYHLADRVLILLDRDFRPDFVYPTSVWAHSKEAMDVFALGPSYRKAAGITTEYDTKKIELLNIFLSRCKVVTEKEVGELERQANTLTYIVRRPAEWGKNDAARLAITTFFFGHGGNSHCTYLEEKVTLPVSLGFEYRDTRTENVSAIEFGHSYYLGKEIGVIGRMYVNPSIWADFKFDDLKLIEDGGMFDGEGDTWTRQGLILQYQYDPERDHDLLMAILESIQPQIDQTVDLVQHARNVTEERYNQMSALFASVDRNYTERIPFSIFSDLTQRMSVNNCHSELRGYLRDIGIDPDSIFLPGAKKCYDLSVKLRVSYSSTHMTLYGVLEGEEDELQVFSDFSSDGTINDYDDYWLERLRNFARTVRDILR